MRRAGAPSSGRVGRVGVVDYGAGNLRSVETALRHLGVDYYVCERPEDVAGADRLVFPGVGEARAAMTVLIRTGLDEAIASFDRSGRPLLGICIGCQVALERSEERDATCLGLVPGASRRFPAATGLKVPHMGWNQVTPVREHPLWEGIQPESSFYFVHSYYPEPADEAAVLARTEYGLSFASAIGRDNLFAVQFHPEKSGEVGLKLLANFLAWSP